MTTITRERVAEIIHAAGLEPCDYEEVFGSIKTGEIVAMARIALASLEAEPVAYADPQSFDNFKSMGGKNAACTKEWMWRDSGEGLIPVYAAPPAPVVPTFEEWLEIRGNKPLGWVKDAMRESYDACRAAMLQGSQPVSNRDELPEEKGASLQLRNLIRQRHAEWSDKTFGDVGPVGPLKHLSKEALEAAAEPDDLSEWADMQFLLWDAQRRAGICDGEITAAMEEKLKVNMARQWPEPKDGEPRLHIKEPRNSPVIPYGWVLVPVEPTEDMIVNGFESEPDESFSDEKEWEAYDSMSGCQQAAHRAKLCWAAMIKSTPKREFY